MKKLHLISILLISLLSCAPKPPTQFSEAALNDTFTALDGSQTTLKAILEQHKGKPIVIDVWASWCSDCIKSLPKTKALQAQFPNAVYLFLSMDRQQDAWKKGIEKYNVIGQHYHVSKDWDTPFCKFINLDWIPRYMVVDTKGNIALFNAITPDDEALINVLKQL